MAIAETQVYTPQAPRPKVRLLEDERWLALVLLVPTLVLLGTFIAYPFLRGILLSVTDARVGVPGDFVGLANFYKIFNDGIFRTSVYNTFIYTGVTTVFKLALGLWLALLLNRNFRGKAFTRAFILLPFIRNSPRWRRPDIRCCASRSPTARRSRRNLFAGKWPSPSPAR
jgi:multiple sugar transport system permease protein